MHQIKTQLRDFSAAHRLIKDYQGKCRHLHGHDYRVFLTFSSPELDHHDFVTDFSDIKALCCQWVTDNWDHGTLISSNDVPLLEFVRSNNQKHFIFEDGSNTTVEVLSHHLYKILNPMIEENLTKKNAGIKLVEVEIWETQNACARYCPKETYS